MQSRKFRVVPTLETKHTDYLEGDCSSLQGGFRGEAQLHSRVSSGDQQGSSGSERAAVPHWARHHHEPGEVAHGGARQLQRPQDWCREECFQGQREPGKEKMRWTDESPWLDVLRGDCCGPRCLSAAPSAGCPRTSRQTSAAEPLSSLSGGKAHTPPLAKRVDM